MKKTKLEIWASMTPQQRDYDRFMGVIPPGASWICETQEGKDAVKNRIEEKGLSCYEQGCSCHISPPCSYCTRTIDEEEEPNKTYIND